MINALLVVVSEDQLRSNLRQDLPLVILGSIIATIGVAAVVAQLSLGQSRERVLLWFGLFAGPYGLRLLMNTTPMGIRTLIPGFVLGHAGHGEVTTEGKIDGKFVPLPGAASISSSSISFLIHCSF